MFLEITDISTGTPVQEPLNAYSINYVYSRQEGSKYNLIYVLTNGIRKIEEFNSQSDLNDRIAEIEELSGGGGTNVYTYKGSCTFENLPTSDQVVGDVWNITNDFTLGGKSYPAGTNVAWDGTDWDALAGSIDLSSYYTKTETDSKIADNNLDNMTSVDLSVAANRVISLDTGGKRLVHLGSAYSNSGYEIRFSQNNTLSAGITVYGVYGMTGPTISIYGNYGEASDGDILAKWDMPYLQQNTVSNYDRYYTVMLEEKFVIKDTNDSTGFSIKSYKVPTGMSSANLPKIPSTNDSATISSYWRFSQIPKYSSSELTPTENTHLVNKKYVDDLVGGVSPNVSYLEPNTSDAPYILSEFTPGMYFLGCDVANSSNLKTYYFKLYSDDTSYLQSNAKANTYLYYTGDIESIPFPGSKVIGNFYTPLSIKDSSLVHSVGSSYTPIVYEQNSSERKLRFYSSQTYDSITVSTPTASETITGLKTFNTLPESSVVPTTDNQLVNKKYVDDNSGMSKFNYDDNEPDQDLVAMVEDCITNQEDPGMFQCDVFSVYDEDVEPLNIRELGFGILLMKYDSTDQNIKGTFYGNGGQATFDLAVEEDQSLNEKYLVMSNYYNLADSIGDINAVLSTLTIPSAVEQALSEI